MVMCACACGVSGRACDYACTRKIWVSWGFPLNAHSDKVEEALFVCLDRFMFADVEIPAMVLVSTEMVKRVLRFVRCTSVVNYINSTLLLLLFFCFRLQTLHFNEACVCMLV